MNRAANSLSEFQPYPEIALHDGKGIYAFAITDSNAIPSIAVAPSGILYVGMTEQALDIRNHFTHAHSGFSTFRRSLGAILKEPLNLTAYKRSAGSSPTNCRNYRFSDGGEHRLSQWMMENLLLAQHEIDSGIAAAEAGLIAELEPPLNLTGWRNPQGKFIKSLRANCASEAKANGAPLNR